MRRLLKSWIARAVLSVSLVAASVALGLVPKAVNISDLQRKPGS